MNFGIVCYVAEDECVCVCKLVSDEYKPKCGFVLPWDVGLSVNCLGEKSGK